MLLLKIFLIRVYVCNLTWIRIKLPIGIEGSYDRLVFPVDLFQDLHLNSLLNT